MPLSLARGSLIAATAILLASCASVPMSTLWALRNFEPGDLATLSPAQIRIAALIEPGPMMIDTSRSQLVLRLHPLDESQDDEIHLFGLTEASDGPAGQIGDRQAGWQDLRLSDEGELAFAVLQPQLATVRQDYRGLSFGVDIKMSGELPRHVDVLYFTTRLRLAPDQKVLTLLDRARMPVTHLD